MTWTDDRPPSYSDRSRATAYRTFFLVAAAIHLCSSLLFLRVGRELRRARLDPGGAATRAAASLGRGEALEAPAMPTGAWLCDSLCFRRGKQLLRR